MKMTRKAGLSAALFAAGLNSAFAAASAEEAKQLGTTLTPWGAEIAGNGDGSIPAYTGGLTKPPASYDRNRPDWRPDPFADEKPLFRIDAKNYRQHKDRLTPGTIALIERYPETFFLDVFKTHRTAAYPKDWQENSVKNAGRCTLTNDGDGLDTSTGCGGGLLFPIPKTGLEVMWNKLSAYKSTGILVKDTVAEYVKPSGEVVSTAHVASSFFYPLGDPSSTVKNLSFAQRAEYKGPTRTKGNTVVYYDDVEATNRTSYTYLPSTRRVRLSPDTAADTPIAGMGGASTYDDDSLFSGKRDRYEWTLIGKKEIYLPYNNYKFSYPDPAGGCTPEKYTTPKHPKSDCLRWELHRVWHVQATLKEGKRHIYAKRDFFFDEDAWSAGLAENYDHAGNLYRYNVAAAIPMYDALIPGFTEMINIDLISGVYVVKRNMTGIKTMALKPQLLIPESTTRLLLE